MSLAHDFVGECQTDISGLLVQPEEFSADLLKDRRPVGGFKIRME